MRSATTGIAKVLMDRRTWRQFGKGPIDRNELAQLLRLTSGITHWLTVPGLGEVPLKTSPSGGARHPIETYVLALNVRDVPAGIYRYAPERHELDLLRDGATASDLGNSFRSSPGLPNAAVVCFFTAVFERTQWRYEFARAYRVRPPRGRSRLPDLSPDRDVARTGAVQHDGYRRRRGRSPARGGRHFGSGALCRGRRNPATKRRPGNHAGR